MVSLEDCIAFCGLDEDEVAAISEHEHIPEIAATALADYLLKQPHGGETIRAMIIDDIHGALNAGREALDKEALRRRRARSSGPRRQSSTRDQCPPNRILCRDVPAWIKPAKLRF
jgi:hypothetical protein